MKKVLSLSLSIISLVAFAMWAPDANAFEFDSDVVLDLDIKRFQIAKNVNVGKPLKRIRITVENTNGGGQNAALATLVGVQDGKEVYNEERMVFDLSGRGQSRFAFPAYTPIKKGTIWWTVVIADDDPDDDTATASTRVR